MNEIRAVNTRLSLPIIWSRISYVPILFQVGERGETGTVCLGIEGIEGISATHKPRRSTIVSMALEPVMYNVEH